MIGLGDGGVSGSTNVDVLTDGVDWSWAATPSVNLTNSSFLVNGQSGPGYVTFAPEAGRTITLDNTWSGVGGMAVNGPGTLIIAGNNTYTGNTTISQGTLRSLLEDLLLTARTLSYYLSALFTDRSQAMLTRLALARR